MNARNAQSKALGFSRQGHFLIFLAIIPALGLIFYLVWHLLFVGYLPEFTWRTTQGKVLLSHVIRSPNSDLNSPDSSYQPLVIFNYKVGTDWHVGTEVRPSSLKTTLMEAAAIYRNYAPGSMVPIYFDPMDPTHSALLPSSARLLPHMALVILLSGIGCFLWRVPVRV